MKRTTIVLPDDLRQRIQRAAADRGVSMSEMIRRAMEEELSKSRPKPKSLGIGDSGRTDIGRRAGEIDYEPPPWR